MQLVHEPHPLAHRRPAALDFVAAGLLVAAVVLHVVAMFPTYFVGSGSLASQTDQAALYAVLAASWALALAVGLTGPHRTPVAAAMAVGIAVTELGFRGADLGDAARYGTSTVGAGLWLMDAGWAVGAAAAVISVLAARARHAPRSKAIDVRPIDTVPARVGPEGPSPYEAAGSSGWGEPAAPASDPPNQTTIPDQSDPAAGAPLDDPAVSVPTPDPTVSVPTPDPTVSIPAPDPTGVYSLVVPTTVRATQEPVDEDRHERLAWTMLVVVLSAVVAGSFLPAWDKASAVSTQSGRSVSRTLGNAFVDQPWEQVVGTVAAAAAMLLVPIVCIRLRNKAVGAAAVVGSLLVLLSQLVAAVVQVDLPVPPADFGVSSSQASQLGLQLSLKLTGWFTLDALAAYALFATVMVWATLRVVQENSTGMSPTAPDWRNPAMPSAS